MHYYCDEKEAGRKEIRAAEEILTGEQNDSDRKRITAWHLTEMTKRM